MQLINNLQNPEMEMLLISKDLHFDNIDNALDSNS